ncbi:T9SS type A sorting domain-containing protein [Hymenobacter lapidiphilus]|uniref:T9SS type A sorting domain-containing protein n=1 Tax=Hymenobacter sp. CCM 8763 TaxID=2303334 RepID=UPI0011C119FA|nr:T9SS type A sorting domain-containing protein [Hymenobacter sp. CCM 8763]
MKAYTPLLFTLLLLLCVGAMPVQAQSQLWKSRYRSPVQDNLQGTLIMRSGGYLLSGTESSGLFLVRTKDQGDTIWTKKLRMKQLTSVKATDLLREDEQGHLLLIGTGNKGVATATFLVLLNQATGDTIWTRTLTGPTAPDYTDLAWTPANDYVLTANIEGRPYLVRMSAAGQITRQTPVDYAPGQPGGVTRMARGAGGYWVAVNSSTSSTDSGTIKMVFVSDAGVRGTEYLTSLRIPYGNSIHNLLPGRGIRSFLPVEDGNFLVVDSGAATKLSPTFTTLWTRKDFKASPSSPGARALLQGVRTTSGNYVFVTISGEGSHSVKVDLLWVLPDGTPLRSGFYFSGLDLGTPDKALMQVNPVTGQFALATSISGDYEMVGLSGDAVLAAAPATAAAAAQLYPNPITEAERLTIIAPVPLTGPYLLADMQGRVVRSGRMQLTAPGRYALSLSGLTAGLYQLQLTDSQGQRSVLRVLKK